MSSINPFLWYRDKDSVKIGDVRRYIIEYTRINEDRERIYLRLKNIENAGIRAIHLLKGPFILYCHVVPFSYNQNEQFKEANDKGISEVQFNNGIQPGQTFNVELLLNENSFKDETEDGNKRYEWSVDIISQIYVSRSASIVYDFMIGDDLKDMKKLNRGILQNSLSGLNKEHSRSVDSDKGKSILGESTNTQLVVEKKDTKQLWNLSPKDPKKPIHLIILTHGIFSNLTADMLYLKEALENVLDDNIVVSGYERNAGRTERGVKKLGIACSGHVLRTIDALNMEGNISKISFIGHSLGGMVQLYCIKHILQIKGADYFEKLKIEPTHLVFLASPFLGILNEMSFLIALFLDLGSLGKTGRDLTLSKKLPNLKSMAKHETNRKRDTLKAVLETLPDNPLKDFMSKFKHLTLYANAVNDGIVPLRTSALLYLDYEALGDVNAIKKHKSHEVTDEAGRDAASIKTNNTADTVAEVPADSKQLDNINKKDKGFARKYANFISLNFTDKSDRKENSSEKQLNSDTESSPNTFHSSSRTTTSNNTSHGIPNIGKALVKKKLEKKTKKIKRFNAKGTSWQGEPEDFNDDESDTNTYFNIPPKASAIESAFYTLICPTPSEEYITNPKSRNPVIFHDRYYHFDNLPISIKEETSQKRSFLKSRFLPNKDWKLEKQVKIAKKYHAPEMNWRKVLVHLPPDAHNNIIVRRRFSNGYGWGVIDHLCSELFNSEVYKKDQNSHKLNPKI